MISKNKQICAWNENQFKLLKAFIEYFGIGQRKYYLFYDSRTKSTVIEQARNVGFLPVKPSDTPDYKTFQLDVVLLNKDGDEKRNRCAFVIREGAFSMKYTTNNELKETKRVITRTDLIVLFIAFVAAHQSDVQQPRPH